MWCSRTAEELEGVQKEGKSGNRLAEDDKLTIRAGNEKDTEEAADTVDCCSLRSEHIKLLDEMDGQKYVVAGRQQRLRMGTFAWVDVIYVSPAEALSSQEMLGRMDAPIQSPYVYTTGNGGHPGGCRGMRIILGALVRAIPLASPGMESDWKKYEEAN